MITWAQKVNLRNGKTERLSCEDVAKLMIGSESSVGLNYNSFIEVWKDYDAQNRGMQRLILRELRGINEKLRGKEDDATIAMDRTRTWLNEMRPEAEELQRRKGTQLKRIAKMTGGTFNTQKLEMCSDIEQYRREFIEYGELQAYHLLSRDRKTLRILKAVIVPKDLMKLPGIGRAHVKAILISMNGDTKPKPTRISG